MGDHGEAIAVAWLQGQGYEILGTNIRVGRNEIDLICRTDAEVVFVEVKAGSSHDYGDPIHRVGRCKRRAVLAAARRWLLGHPQSNRGVRFDIISIHTDCARPAVDHRVAAFTADDI
jgi:putative endonuclease